MSTAQPAHAMNNLGPKLKREKLFMVNFIANSNGEQTPISKNPLPYEAAMAQKAEAEKSTKYDLKKGYLAALRLTEDEQDRYEARLRRQAEAGPAAAPAQPAQAPKAKKEEPKPEE